MTTSIIDELRKERKYDITNDKVLVEKLYNECLKLIKFKNKFNFTHMTYEVPAMLPGFPLYNVEKISYLLSKYLKKKGFKTTYVFPNKIYIKW